MAKIDVKRPDPTAGAVALTGALLAGNQDGMRLAAKRDAAVGVAELALIPVTEVQDRADQDTRTLKPFDLVDLAYAIRDEGLISPIAIDSGRRLLAGGHRLAAHRLMSCAKDEDREITFRQMVGTSLDLLVARQSPDKRGDFQLTVTELYKRVRELGHHPDREKILTRVFPDIDSSTDEGRERALVIETTENTRRKGYTDGELRKIAERFRHMGYADSAHGAKNLFTALGYYTSMSYSTLRRKLRQGADPNASVRRLKAGDLTHGQLVLALRKFLERLPEAQHGVLPEALDHLEKLPAPGDATPASAG